MQTDASWLLIQCSWGLQQPYEIYSIYAPNEGCHSKWSPWRLYAYFRDASITHHFWHICWGIFFRASLHKNIIPLLYTYATFWIDLFFTRLWNRAPHCRTAPHAQTEWMTVNSDSTPQSTYGSWSGTQQQHLSSPLWRQLYVLLAGSFSSFSSPPIHIISWPTETPQAGGFLLPAPEKWSTSWWAS